MNKKEYALDEKKSALHERRKILAYWEEYPKTTNVVAKAAIATALCESLYLFGSLYDWDDSLIHKRIVSDIFSFENEKENPDSNICHKYINFDDMSFISPDWNIKKLKRVITSIKKLSDN
jgi:hypothetical protein